MPDEHNRAVAEWLAAEAEGRPDEADRLFASVFLSGVPRLAPAPGLGDRVLARVGSPTAAPGALPLPAWARVAALVAIVLGGLAAAAVSSVPAMDLARTSWVVGVKAVGTGWLLAGALLRMLVHGWSDLVGFARPLTLVVASGPGSAVLLANLALAALASVALKRMLPLEEEPS